ncbi:MAG TPA: hypothetical protein VJK49_02795 [Candidatus Limnocylindrales bacterium]|nr:hypothetical protein [Candidatus Limnocylindrales bacterium]
MTDMVLVVSRRALVVGGALVALAIVLVLLVAFPAQREQLALAIAPRATADPATLARQRTGAEHSIQRGWTKAVAQLDQVRALTLAIPRDEAEAIDKKARDDLTAIRRQALVALAGAGGIPAGQVEQYVLAVEAQLGQGTFAGEAGVLLAPGLFDVVRRADELFQQTADTATRQLTRAPSPSPSPRPTALPTASPTPSPSPTVR